VKRILFRFFVFFAISSRVAGSAETPALIDRPAAGAGPTQVSVGIWIVDITNIDSTQQNFTADVAVVFRWKDARLAHTGTGLVYYALDQIWTPRVGIANETIIGSVVLVAGIAHLVFAFHTRYIGGVFWAHALVRHL